jgi:hypothetical protein
MAKLSDLFGRKGEADEGDFVAIRRRATATEMAATDQNRKPG